MLKNKYIKKFSVKDLSWKIKKEYLFEIEEPFLIISSPDLINQKNSYNRKEIDKQIFNIIREEVIQYSKNFNLQLSTDLGYFLKRINKPNVFSEQQGKLVFLFVVDGKGRLKINNKIYNIKEEDCFIFPSHFTYNYSLEDKSDLLVVYSFIE